MCQKIRCSWAGDLPLYVEYHDREWGRPVHDDAKLFELLILEGMQAGLSWITVLKKREAFRSAFDGFDPERVARYGGDKIQELLADKGIIRNRLKINAAVANARAFLEVREKHGSFDRFIWAYVDGAPIQNRWETEAEIPASTPLSCRISGDLKKLGFRFAGPTVVYAFMQAAGLVNDHVADCFVRRELAAGLRE